MTAFCMPTLDAKKDNCTDGLCCFGSRGGLVSVAIVTINVLSLTYLSCVGYSVCIHMITYCCVWWCLLYCSPNKSKGVLCIKKNCVCFRRMY